MGAFGTGHGGASRSDVRRLGLRFDAQMVGGLRCLAAGGEEGALSLQEFDPVPDVPRVPHVAIEPELGT